LSLDQQDGIYITVMYQVRYATEADMPALCDINYVSFKDYRFRSAVFPQCEPATLKKFKALNGMKQMANPEMHVITIEDSNTGQLVGYARWLIPEYLEYLPLSVSSVQRELPSQPPRNSH
jgi:hypothetical protein